MNATMQKKPRKAKKVDVIAAAQEMATIMRQDPSFIEKPIIQKGDELLGIFSDDTFRGSFKNFNNMKIEALKMAIEDLSMGGQALISSTIGLTFKNNQIQTFIVPFGTMASGNVMYSISLKNRAAFKSWRNEGTIEMPQEEINTAIYRLTALWSQLLP